LARRANTRTNIGHDAEIIAEVEIDIGHQQPFGLLTVVFVGPVPTHTSISTRIPLAIESRKIGLAAIFDDGVRTEPIIELVTDAEAADRRTVETAVIEEFMAADDIETGMRQFVDALVAHAEMPTQIPSACGNDDGNFRWRFKIKIRAEC